MSNTIILGWVTFIYLAASLFYLIYFLRGKSVWGRLGTIVTGIGWVAQSFALILRWIETYRLGIGHAPLSNFYESLIFFSWAIVVIYLILERRAKSAKLGVFVLPISFLFMAYASLSPNVSSRIQPLIPALQSNWLVSHVVTCFLGYAAFAVAFGMGILYLIKLKLAGASSGESPIPEEGIINMIRSQTPQQTARNANAAGFNSSKRNHTAGMLENVPEPDILEELIYQSVSMGFVIFSVGIMTGSVWAHYAWGSYWSWDPKETWSLITWIVYAAMLHARMMRGWGGKRMAVLAIVGFCAVLFTYFGVNYLAGLHSYL